MTPTTLKLDEITVDPRLQMRVKLDEEAIEDYCRIYKGEAHEDGEAETRLPALTIVRYVATGENVLVDGRHRLEAARRAGLDAVEVVSTDGDYQLARDMARASNRFHGVRLSNADKRRIVQTAIEDHPNWSDGAIAKECGVSQPFVSKIRHQSGHNVMTLHRQGLDGKTYSRPPVFEDCLNVLDAAGLLPDEGRDAILSTTQALYGSQMLLLGVKEGGKMIDTPRDADWLLINDRVEDVPLVYFAGREPHQGDPPEPVVESCRLFLEYTIRTKGVVAGWERAAFWWACQCAMMEHFRKEPAPWLDDWARRFCTGVAYWNLEGRFNDPRNMSDDRRFRFWWGFHSDMRHAGILEEVSKDLSPGHPLYPALAEGFWLSEPTGAWPPPSSLFSKALWAHLKKQQEG
jgi:hypothetical protein